MAKIRPIDANALFDALYDNEFQTFCPLDEVSDVIAAATTLDYAPVRHGEWTLVEKFFPFGEEGEVDSDWFLVCSECGREVPVYEYWPPDIDIEKLTEEYPYCHCGAKMVGGKKHD